MAKPSSFDNAPLRRRKGNDARQVGKKFENLIRTGLYDARLPNGDRVGWWSRMHDQVNYAGGMAQPTPPDFIAIGQKHSLLIECKAFRVEGDKSIPLASRLTQNQWGDLQRFATVGHALIACLLYDTGSPRDRFDIFVLEVRNTARYFELHNRKSIVVSDLESLQAAGHWSGTYVPASAGNKAMIRLGWML